MSKARIHIARTHRVMLAGVFDIFRIVSFLQHILFLLYIFFLLLLCLPFFNRIRSFWNSDDTLYGDNFVMCNTPSPSLSVYCILFCKMGLIYIMSTRCVCIAHIVTMNGDREERERLIQDNN